MKKGRSRIVKQLVNLAPPVLLLIAIIVMWEVLVDFLDIPQYLVPSVSAVGGEILSAWSVIIPNTWVTYYETLVGYVLAIIFGVLSALVLVYSDIVRRSFYPLALAFQSLPKSALAPLFIVWFGVGLLPKIIIALIVSYFPIMITMVVGFGDVDKDMLELARSMRATNTQIFTKIRLPHSLPYFFSSLKVALPLAVVGAVIGEFIASMEGLGNLILISTSFLNTAMLFACLIMLMAVSTILLAAITIIESIALKWNAEK